MFYIQSRKKKKSLWIKSIYPSESKSLCPQNIMHSNKHQKSHKGYPGAYNNLCDNFELIYFVIYSLKWKLAQFSLTSSAFTSQKPSALSLSVQPSPALGSEQFRRSVSWLKNFGKTMWKNLYLYCLSYPEPLQLGSSWWWFLVCFTSSQGKYYAIYRCCNSCPAR